MGSHEADSEENARGTDTLRSSLGTRRTHRGGGCFPRAVGSRSRSRLRDSKEPGGRATDVRVGSRGARAEGSRSFICRKKPFRGEKRTMWGGGVWGSAAFDPAPEAVPAPAPYPDGTYAMTPSQFDAQVESWTAKQADFDASLRQDRAFVQLTRQREIRAAGAAAFVALLPLTSVFSALTALPVTPHADPAARALALHGACDRWAGAPVTGGDLAWEEETFRGVDVKAAEVERLALRVATTLLVVAAAVALGIAYGVCARAASVMRRAATFRDANARVSSGKKKNETAPREISTDALETPARVSPPPPPPPAPRRPGSLGPLSRPPDLRIFADDTKTKPHPPPPPPPPRTPRGGSLTTETSSSPASALRRSLAMGKLRRAVSSRANARLREVNAAANEAPTPEVARRVKTRLDPSDVLAELRPSRLSWPRRAARRAHTRAPSRRCARRWSGWTARRARALSRRSATAPRRCSRRSRTSRACCVCWSSRRRGWRVCASRRPTPPPFASAARAPSR